jgi:hypothetical protein
MWLGIRLGNLSPVKLAGKQWGNAWGDRVRKTPLSNAEIEALEASLKRDSDLDEVSIVEFIRVLESRNPSRE